MTDKKKLQMQIDTLMKVIGNLQDDMESNEEFNENILHQVMERNAFFIKYMSDMLEVPDAELISDFEEWAEENGYKTTISLEEHQKEDPPTEEDPPKLWSIDEIMKDLKPPEEN